MNLSPAFARYADTLRRLDAADMSPETRATWEEARKVFLDLMVTHRTALQTAARAEAFIYAHDQWEHAQTSGDEVLIGSARDGVVANKSALQGCLRGLCEHAEPEEIEF